MKPADILNGIQNKQFILEIEAVFVSMINNKKELLTIFFSGLNVEIEEELMQNTTISLSLDYLQMDNQ